MDVTHIKIICDRKVASVSLLYIGNIIAMKIFINNSIKLSNFCFQYICCWRVYLKFPRSVYDDLLLRFFPFTSKENQQILLAFFEKKGNLFVTCWHSNKFYDALVYLLFYVQNLFSSYIFKVFQILPRTNILNWIFVGKHFSAKKRMHSVCSTADTYFAEHIIPQVNTYQSDALWC